MAALLEVRDLRVVFPGSPPTHAVRGVDFEIEAGKTLGLVGESGSGKSATSLAIMRLLPPQAQVSGSVIYSGTDLLELSGEEMRRYRGARIGMIFQEPMTALNPVMRIGDQIAEALLAHAPHTTKQEVKQRVLESLRDVAIPAPEERVRAYPHQLSGGQRQRVMIAMALVNRPQLLIADEPTTALDVTVQAQILELLRQLRDKFNLAMLFISHDLGVVAQVSDRIAVMYAGEMVEIGGARQVFGNPNHPYTRGLLASSPSLRTDRTQPLRAVEWMTHAEAPRPLREVEAGHWARN